MPLRRRRYPCLAPSTATAMTSAGPLISRTSSARAVAARLPEIVHGRPATTAVLDVAEFFRARIVVSDDRQLAPGPRATHQRIATAVSRSLPVIRVPPQRGPYPPVSAPPYPSAAVSSLRHARWPVPPRTGTRFMRVVDQRESPGPIHSSRRPAPESPRSRRSPPASRLPPPSRSPARSARWPRCSDPAAEQSARTPHHADRSPARAELPDTVTRGRPAVHCARLTGASGRSAGSRTR